MLRYSIITYHHTCGSDEKPEHSTLKSAKQAAHNYYTNENYEGVVIYDLKNHCIYDIYGFIPSASMPITY